MQTVKDFQDAILLIESVKKQDSFYGMIETSFRLMDICEGAIKRACAKWPEAGPLLDGAFMTLCPAHTMTPKLYEAHCNELLKRIAKDGDIRLPTQAEKLQALMEMSLKTPLNTASTSLYARLLTETFPRDAVRVLIGDAKEWLREDYAGQIDEYNALMTKKLTVKDRAKPVARTKPSQPGLWEQ